MAKRLKLKDWTKEMEKWARAVRTDIRALEREVNRLQKKQGWKETEWKKPYDKR